MIQQRIDLIDGQLNSGPVAFPFDEQAMATNVVKVRPDQITDIEKAILRNKHSSSLSLTNQHEAFRIHLASDTIVGYKSGKIVSTGSQAAAAVRSAVFEVIGHSEVNLLTIGSDEAGKGEWLGPLVVAAVALDSEQSLELQSIGVADSKGISLTRISDLSADIERVCRYHRSVLIPPRRFNAMFYELHREGKSLNDLLAWAHAKAISEAYSALSTAEKAGLRVVIDEFARNKTERRLRRVLNLEDIELVQKPRAEDEIAVAAASILAREARERWIDVESSRLKTDLRELSSVEAYKHSDRSEFAKTSYLETLHSKR